MSQQLSVNAEARKSAGSNSNRRLRRVGKVPGVIDRKGKDNVAVTLDYSAFVKVFSQTRQCRTLDIVVGKETYTVLVRDFDIEPISKRISHVDFLEVAEGRKMYARIPIKLVGSSPGVQIGGTLEHILPSLNVKCDPQYLRD